MKPFWPLHEEDIEGEAVRTRDLRWAVLVGAMYRSYNGGPDWWTWENEKLAPCIILEDGSVVAAADGEEAKLLDSCGGGSHAAWELQDNAHDWYEAQAMIERGETVPEDHGSKKRDAVRDFWTIEDCIVELLSAGAGNWTDLAAGGTLQELGAWLLDICLPHMAVQGKIVP